MVVINAILIYVWGRSHVLCGKPIQPSASKEGDLSKVRGPPRS